MAKKNPMERLEARKRYTEASTAASKKTLPKADNVPHLADEDYAFNAEDIVYHVGHKEVTSNRPAIFIVSRAAQQVQGKVVPVYAGRVVSFGDKPDMSGNLIIFFEKELRK